METQDKNRQNPYETAEISEIGNRVRYIERMVGDLASRLEDHYRLLLELREDMGQQDPGLDWFEELYEHDRDYC